MKIEESRKYQNLLYRVMRTAEPIYLYGTDLTGYPSHVDASMADSFDGPDVMRSVITLRLVVEDKHDYEKYQQFRYFMSWREEDLSHQFVIPGGAIVNIPGPTFPLYVEAKVPLKYISDIPFDGLPNGRLLYGKD